MSKIYLSKEHGLAPVLTFCRLCGGEATEIILLGASADKVMKELYIASGGKYGAEKYEEWTQARVPSCSPCDKCQGALKTGGIIFIAADTGQMLRLDKAMVDSLIGRVADARGRVLDFEKIRGKIIKLTKAFWKQDKEGNIRLRDPKEWTEQNNQEVKTEKEKDENPPTDSGKDTAE